MEDIPKHEMIMMDNIQREFDHQQSLCRQKAYKLHRQQQTRHVKKKRNVEETFSKAKLENRTEGKKKRLVDRKRKADKIQQMSDDHKEESRSLHRNRKANKRQQMSDDHKEQEKSDAQK